MDIISAIYLVISLGVIIVSTATWVVKEIRNTTQKPEQEILQELKKINSKHMFVPGKREGNIWYCDRCNKMSMDSSHL